MTSLNELNGTYTIDPAHSVLGFTVKHAMISKVRGSFDDFEGTATTGANLADAKIDITAQIASISTGQAQRDAHLRTGDFFDAAQFATMTFTSTEITAKGEDELTVTGDLTIRGVTKPVTFDFEYNGTATDPMGNERIGFEGKATIDRKDFGLTYNAALETGGVLVGDKITLDVEISAIKQA